MLAHMAGEKTRRPHDAALNGLMAHPRSLCHRDSLEECLDIVCNQPEYAYEIAQGGFMLRDNPRIRFDRFDNIIALAKHRIYPAIRA